jgi:hypothetical protein
VGDGTLGGGGRRVADGVGRPVLVSAVAFFLAAGADGAGEREQRTSRAEVADGSGMSRAGGSSRRGSDAAAAAAASRGRTRGGAEDPGDVEEAAHSSALVPRRV